MAKRVPHSTRAILNTISQLKMLERTLKQRVKSGTPAGSIKVRAVIIDATNLIKQLEDIAGRTTSAAGLSIEEVKQQLSAESAKRRSGQLGSSDMCEEPVEKAAGPDLAGVMVALYPPKRLADKLAVEGGTEPKAIHCTLLYFEDKQADRDDWDLLSDAVSKVAAKHDKLKGHIAGAGRFVNEESDVAYASLDAPGINELRQDLLEAAEKAGFPVSKSHSFSPHLTTIYLDKQGRYPAPVERDPVGFSRVYVVTGDKRLSSHPLGQ